MHLITHWAEQISQHQVLAEQVGRHWLEDFEEIHEKLENEQHDWASGSYFQAGTQSALVLKKLVGRPGVTAENHSVLKD